MKRRQVLAGGLVAVLFGLNASAAFAAVPHARQSGAAITPGTTSAPEVPQSRVDRGPEQRMAPLMLAQTAAQRGGGAYVMTEIELQSELMSYADRFASILVQGFEDFDRLNPTVEARRFVLDDMIHAIASAFTTAAEPNPQVALLDLVVVTTLGRMIYEDNIRRRYGKTVAPMVQGFRELEKDLWQIATRVLSKEQQAELRGAIIDWRNRNKDKIVYNYLRFSDFAADRRKSTLVQKGETGGLFASVQEATQQVEETRMLAERGMYLATRLPLLTGAFSEVWMSQLIANPDAQTVLKDFHNFSDVSQRLATVAEELPERLMKDLSTLRWRTVNQIMREMETLTEKTVDDVMARVAVEREAFIDQFMDRLVGEQMVALEALMAEEARLTGLMAELRAALREGNALLTTANTLTDKFPPAEPSAEPGDSEPFDIVAYQAAMAELTTTATEFTRLVETTNRLVGAGGLEALLPRLIEAVDNVGQESEELVDHTVQQFVLLIVAWMIAYVIARLVSSYFIGRFVEARTQGPEAAGGAPGT